MAAVAKQLGDLMTMEALARAAHMNHRRARTICINAGIAIRWGKRGIRARLSEFEKVVLSYHVEQPKGSKRTVTRRRQLVGLHPDVNC